MTQSPGGDRLNEIESALRQSSTSQNIESSLDDLITLYEQCDDQEQALAIRQAFLRLLKRAAFTHHERKVTQFLAAHVEPDDFHALSWKGLEEQALFFDSIYNLPFQDQDTGARIQQQIQHWLRDVLRQYEQDGEQEKLFQLLQLSPRHIVTSDPELRRLRHRATAYERQRVNRHRRNLYIYLVVQALFVLFVFPLLFINAENGRLQRQVEELADVELGDEGYQPVSFSEAVYWSIITASSIGYGDITPTTTTGRIIAATLGTMGVVTVGIFAGLVLNWLSLRHIN